MVARLQVIGADEGSLQGELGGEHLHADIYLIVCVSWDLILGWLGLVWQTLVHVHRLSEGLRSRQHQWLRVSRGAHLRKRRLQGQIP